MLRYCIMFAIFKSIFISRKYLFVFHCFCRLSKEMRWDEASEDVGGDICGEEKKYHENDNKNMLHMVETKEDVINLIFLWILTYFPNFLLSLSSFNVNRMMEQILLASNEDFFSFPPKAYLFEKSISLSTVCREKKGKTEKKVSISRIFYHQFGWCACVWTNNPHALFTSFNNNNNFMFIVFAFISECHIPLQIASPSRATALECL